MEKEPQPDSMATVAIKPEYAPSEVYGSEPPPAYHRSQSSAVQVAKIIAVTIVVVSVVLGGFILASAYVSANASCRQLQDELDFLSETVERLPLQPEALVQDEPEQKASNVHQEHTKPESEKREAKKAKEEESDSNSISDSNSESDEDDSDEDKAITFHLPLQLDFDELAGMLMEKNIRSRMNCVVEKKRAEEIVDHKPKTVALPFGLNLTTDPRYEKLSGERMAIFCESGNMQSHEQPQQAQVEPQAETIMIHPVMIPLVGNSYETHMPQRAQPLPPHMMPPQQQHQQQQPQVHFVPQHVMMPPQAQQQRPMHPMEAMRPPMPQPQRSEMPPAAILHQIAQQIIAQRIMDQQREEEEIQNTNDIKEPEHHQQPLQAHRFAFPEAMVSARLPIPEEVLTQINRLPNREGSMIVVSAGVEPDVDGDDDDDDDVESAEAPAHEVRIVEQTKPASLGAAPQDNRQTYARGIPVHIPVPMMQPQQQQQQRQPLQEPQAEASEQPRPHYVQPRSVRSVDALLAKDTKRVKRCACDCAC